MNQPPTPQPNAPPISVASPLRTNPVPGLWHGLVLSAFGMLLRVWAGPQFGWLVGAFSVLPRLVHASWHAFVDLKRAGTFGLPDSWVGVQ